MSKNLEQFQDYLKKLNQYTRACTLLSWDLYTMTPKNGFEDMADALTFFSTEEFKLSTSQELWDLLTLLNEKEEYDQLNEAMQYTVRTMKEKLEKERRIPQDFYQEFVAERSASMQAWEEAKAAADFSIFAPHLEKLIEMTKKNCSYTDPDKEVYEVLLDEYEKGMDRAAIDRVFAQLKEGLLPLLDQILAASPADTKPLKGTFDPAAQQRVQELLLRYIGFSMDDGAVSESTHPFTTGFSRKDVRLTNHYHEDNPISAMFSAIHEGGHAIFMQNSKPEYDNTPASDCIYMGVHESQSRFYENILGRNRNFWLPIYPQIQKFFPDLSSLSLDDFYRKINHVQNSPIRIEADEVTYCLHIIIRYELELAIFEDQISVEELPKLWNQKMEEYLHITPKDDGEGILQDMHWSDASFGYFPSYLLGSIYGGMFLQALEEDLGSVDQLLADGKIPLITQWLNEKIHQYGNTRLPKEVIANVCHKELSAEPLLEYFRKKYQEIYQL